MTPEQQQEYGVRSHDYFGDPRKFLQFEVSENSPSGGPLITLNVQDDEGNDPTSVFATLFSQGTGSIRFTYHGESPSQTFGHVMRAGESVRFGEPNAIENFSWHRNSGTSELQITLYY